MTALVTGTPLPGWSILPHLRTPPVFSSRVALLVTVVVAPACGGLVVSERTSVDASPGGASDSSASALLPAFDASGLATCALCLGVACEDSFVQCEQSAGCYAGYQCAAGAVGGEAPCSCLGPEDDELGAYLALARCIREAACGGGACAARCETDDASVGIHRLRRRERRSCLRRRRPLRTHELHRRVRRLRRASVWRVRGRLRGRK